MMTELLAYVPDWQIPEHDPPVEMWQIITFYCARRCRCHYALHGQAGQNVNQQPRLAVGLGHHWEVPHHLPNRGAAMRHPLLEWIGRDMMTAPINQPAR
jgi:hypothetical protein